MSGMDPAAVAHAKLYPPFLACPIPPQLSFDLYQLQSWYKFKVTHWPLGNLCISKRKYLVLFLAGGPLLCTMQCVPSCYRMVGDWILYRDSVFAYSFPP